MRFLLLMVVCLAASALEDPTAKLAEINARANAETVAYLKAWLAEADLEPLPLPYAGRKPANTQEEAELKRVKQINFALAQAKAVRDTGVDAVNAHTLTLPANYQPVLEAQKRRPKSRPGE